MKQVNRDTAGFAAFLYAGAVQADRDAERANISIEGFERWNGHIGFVTSIVDHARAIAKVFGKIVREEHCFPGVLEYELIEPLGGRILLDRSITPEHAAEIFAIEYHAWVAQ